MPSARGSALSFSNSHTAPVVSNFISFTSSFTKGVSVYKTPANATLTPSAGTKPQSSDEGRGMKDESSDLDWCSEARVWKILSSAFRWTGGGKRQPGDKDREDGGFNLGQGWTNFIPV